MDKDKEIAIIDENTHQIHELIREKIQFWVQHVLFSRLWWLALVLSVIPWVIWVMYRKKESTDRLLYSGMFVMVISLVLDVMGDQFGFWHYRFNLIPVLPTYFPWDLTLMPVFVMFLIQVRPRLHPIVKGVLFALVTSYIGEPIFEWLEIYTRNHWQRYYSIPIQFLIYVIAHWLSKRKEFDPIS